MIITLGDVTFNTGAFTPAGYRWRARPPEGWWSNEQQVDWSEPTGSDGGSAAQSRTPPATLLLRGMVETQTSELMFAVLDQIKAGMPGPGLGREAVLTVAPPGAVSTWMQVQQEGATPDPWYGARRVTFALKLKAAWPHRRATEQRSVAILPGETLTLANAGTIAAPVTVTADGAGMVRLLHVGSGQVMQTRESVPAGTVFHGTPPLRRRVFTAAGVEFCPMGWPSEWLAIPPGGGDFKNEGDQTLTVTSHDHY